MTKINDWFYPRLEIEINRRFYIIELPNPFKVLLPNPITHQGKKFYYRRFIKSNYSSR